VFDVATTVATVVSDDATVKPDGFVTVEPAASVDVTSRVVVPPTGTYVFWPDVRAAARAVGAPRNVTFFVSTNTPLTVTVIEAFPTSPFENTKNFAVAAVAAAIDTDLAAAV